MKFIRNYNRCNVSDYDVISRAGEVRSYKRSRKKERNADRKNVLRGISSETEMDIGTQEGPRKSM